MIKKREELIAETRRIRDEIEQYFLEVASWNDNYRQPGVAPIVPDPDGRLRRASDKYSKILAAEDSMKI